MKYVKRISESKHKTRFIRLIKEIGLIIISVACGFAVWLLLSV